MYILEITKDKDIPWIRLMSTMMMMGKEGEKSHENDPFIESFYPSKYSIVISLMPIRVKYKQRK